MIDLTRRSALLGLLAAPVIIRTPGLLMPVRKVPATVGTGNYDLAWRPALRPFSPRIGETILINGAPFVITVVCSAATSIGVEARQATGNYPLTVAFDLPPA